MTGSITAGGNGGRPGFRVLSRSRPATSSRINRSRQRHTWLPHPGTSHDLGGAELAAGDYLPHGLSFSAQYCWQLGSAAVELAARITGITRSTSTPQLLR